MNSDTISTSGVIGTELRHTKTAEGLAVTSFRLAASQRKFNRTTSSWEYGETNWFTVTAFRQLALNLAASLNKGDRVVVCGRLRVRNWESKGKSGITVEIDADAVGHDLMWGTSVFTRGVKTASLPDVALELGASRESDGDGRGTPQEMPSFDPDDGAASGSEVSGWAPALGSSPGGVPLNS